MKKRITIRDVAREAGRSIATVSGILNGGKGYAKETVQSVWEIANRLNYIPSSSARDLQKGSLRSGRMKTGLIMYVISYGECTPDEAKDVEFALGTLSCMAKKENYFIVPYPYSMHDGFQCPPLLNGYVEGALVGTPHLEVVRAVSAKVPTILMDVPFTPDLANVSMINGDWDYASRILLKRLHELGHRRVAVLQPYDKVVGVSARDILWGFRKAAEEQDITISEKYSFKAEFMPDNNEILAEQYVKQLVPGIRKGEVTAVFAPHVTYLNFLLPFLKEAGIRIPQDVSLCGPIVSLKKPSGISALWLDRKRLFEEGLKALLDNLAHPSEEVHEIKLRPVLLENDTIGEAAKKR